jgi:uncharacterized protein (DUF58 family)
LTPDARWTVLLAVGLAVPGLAFNSPALVMAAIGLVLLVGGATVWAPLAAYGAEVERERGPATVLEGEPYPLRIVVRSGTVPTRGVLADPLLEKPHAVRASLRGRARHLSVPVTFERRGRRVLEPARLIVRDPLGLAEREVVGEHGGELVVLPRVDPVLAPTAGGDDRGAGNADDLGDGVGASPLEARAIDFEIDGLRPYREGTPASRIHWPAVARTGELVERRLVAGGDSSPLVVLDARDPDDEDSLDMAVRAAASLCVHLARKADGCALLLGGERRPMQIDPELRAGWPLAHARLAVVERGGGIPRIARTGHTGAVVWVCARGGRLPRTARGPAGPTHLVLPKPVPRVPVAFTVAGCAGHSLAAAGRARRETAEASAA